MPTSMDTPFFEHATGCTGHQVSPIPPVYDPQEVIDVIYRLATDPEDEVTFGTAGRFLNFAHHLAPGVVESMRAHQTHKAEIQDAQPAGKLTEASRNLLSPEGK